jgi:ribulose-bisphosphate carboxylase large chain
MKDIAAPTERERTSGVHSYQELYLDLGYVPAATDMLVAFAITPRQDTPMEEAAAAVAAESSTGTWTEVGEDDDGLPFQLRARVYQIADNVAWIAYPIDLFEFGSIPNILSSVVGNVFGFKAVRALRLLDMRVPEPLVDSFPGPAFGIAGIREKLNVHGRALTGSTIKPKLGLSPAEHARRAYETLRGGIDTIKDDENLNGQSWSPFDERIRQTLALVRQAETETGERKGYWANVTAANTEEMLRRANLVADEGGRFVMVDFLTAGFAATASLRAETERLGLGLHAHRAMHAVMDRQPDHGVDFLVIAKWARLLGVDHVHVGTGVGKLEGTIEEMGERRRMMTAAFAPAGGGTLFDQSWGQLRPLVPVASGGLHPGHVPQLDAVFGIDAFFLFGGGVHGHPGGSRAGATAARAAVEAAAGGETLDHAARTCPELRQALDLWSGVRF